MDELLTKYMLNEASDQEQTVIEEWLSRSEDNRRYFDHFRLIWDTSRELKVQSTLDPEASWQEFRQLAARQKPEAVVRKMTTAKWLRMAAAWLLGVGIAAVVYTVVKPKQVELLTLQTTDAVKIDTMADGSVITLNKHSELTYPSRFAGNTRNVKLVKGEAFFNIAHDKTKPFIIGVNDVDVRVVGTSFNIKNKRTSTEVIVETGVVQVIHKSVAIKLAPNDKLSIDSGSGNYRKGLVNDKLYNYYRTNLFVANKTPLWRVAEVLTEAYNIQIVVPDKRLAGMLLSTTLPAGQLDSNLNIICQTLNVHFIKRGGKIIIQ